MNDRGSPSRRLVVAAIGMATAVLATVGRADDEPDPRRALLEGARDSYEFRHEGREERKLEIERMPLLRWTNPLRETDDGAIYLWTHEGRPAVAMCVYTHGIDGFDQEIESLLPTTLTGRRDGEDVWRPDRAGVVFQTVPEAPVPADTPARRLVQMRGIARRFSTEIVRMDTSRHALRMLSQPLFRYGGEDDSVRDGALFGYALGTDPEVLLLLEARKDDDGELRWAFALARMTSAGCAATLGNKEIWSVERWNWVPDPANPYITFRGKLPGTTEELGTP